MGQSNWPSGWAAAVVAMAAVILVSGCRIGASPTQEQGRSAATAVTNQPRTSSPAGPVLEVDDLGVEVSLPGPARRVVTLSPNMAEILCFIGASDRLVGVTEFCKYPPEAAAKPKVGGIVNPSLEKILALRPDLVLAARGNDKAFIAKLRGHGIPVFAADPQTLDDVVRLVKRIGRLVGMEQEAADKAASLSARIRQLCRRAAALTTRPRAVVVIELDPLFVAGPGTFVDDLLSRAGMTNAVEAQRPWVQWSSERLAAARPDLAIIVARHGGLASNEVIQKLMSRSPWRELEAVKAGRVYAVTDDLVTIPGPRLVDGLAELIAVHEMYERSLEPGHGAKQEEEGSRQ